MLFADKNALRTQLKVNMLRIRERELLYYTNNCLAISTSAALLAGFAWYGLTEVPFDSNASAVTQTMYLVITTLIMGLELLTVVNATLCAILGPGLALRGPDGSMHNAVQGMMTHYRFTLACFTLGLICFMLSALLYAWMQFDWTLAMPMTLLIIYFLFILHRYYWRIYRRFRLPAESTVTGAFNVGPGAAGPSYSADAQQQAQMEAQERAQQQEMEQLRSQYGHLPESVRASMGIAGSGGGQ
mmetsp:Transcript_18999/g.48621  ORF Transcript_18999/g.48621 Transcript_18999/m.48621 type:complete len:243 (-) Transcript_18999:409-1137(-)